MYLCIYTSLSLNAKASMHNQYTDLTGNKAQFNAAPQDRLELLFQ